MHALPVLVLLAGLPLAAATPTTSPVRVDLEMPRFVLDADAPVEATLVACAPGRTFDLAVHGSAATPATWRGTTSHDASCARTPLRITPDGDGVWVLGNATRGTEHEAVHVYRLFPMTYGEALAGSGHVLPGALLVVVGGAAVLFGPRRR